MALADDGTSIGPRTEPQGVGAFLRERRIALGLSYADVAHVVKLPPRRIESLEAERWDELPDGPFLRGFLRNVARALDLDATSLMDRVDDSLMRARNPDSILVAPGSTHATLPRRRRGPVDDRHGGRALIFGAFLFALIAALIAWSGTDSFDRTLATGKALIDPSLASSGKASAPSTAPSPTPAAGDATTPATTTEPVAAPAVPPSETTTVAAASPDATTSASPTSPLALLFHFNEDSWVEVRSADGRVLLKALNAAGSEQRIEGEAPYSVIVGNAKGVDLRFRGQPVDLGPYTRDQVARLTLS